MKHFEDFDKQYTIAFYIEYENWKAFTKYRVLFNLGVGIVEMAGNTMRPLKIWNNVFRQRNSIFYVCFIVCCLNDAIFWSIFCFIRIFYHRVFLLGERAQKTGILKMSELQRYVKICMLLALWAEETKIFMKANLVY